MDIRKLLILLIIGFIAMGVPAHSECVFDKLYAMVKNGEEIYTHDDNLEVSFFKSAQNDKQMGIMESGESEQFYGFNVDFYQIPGETNKYGFEARDVFNGSDNLFKGIAEFAELPSGKYRVAFDYQDNIVVGWTLPKEIIMHQATEDEIETRRLAEIERAAFINLEEWKHYVNGQWECTTDSDITLSINSWAGEDEEKGKVSYDSMQHSDYHWIEEFEAWEPYGGGANRFLIIKTSCDREPATHVRYRLLCRYDEETYDELLYLDMLSVDRDEEGFHDCCLIPICNDGTGTLIFKKKSNIYSTQEDVSQVRESFKAWDFPIRDLSGIWTDGQDIWKGTMVENSVFLESGFREDFSFIQDDDTSYTYCLPNCEWATAQYSEINNDGEMQQFMIVYTDKGIPKKIFRLIHDAKEATTMPFAPMYGEYVDQEGRRAIIGSERISMPDFDGVYYPHYVYEAVEPVVFVYPNGLGNGDRIAIYLQMTLDGVDVYEAINEDFESNATDTTAGKLLYSLKYKSMIPRWMPLICDSYVLEQMVEFVPVEILGVMRNLPFALRGYKFGKVLYKDYFEAQPWYTPGDNNADIRISEIEAGNCGLISTIEAQRR